MLDEKVIAKAKCLTGLSTQKEIVDYALRELVRRLNISKILELEGSIDWDGDLMQMRTGRDICEF
jgi:Arc/MetJ family transcription regulator